MARIWKSLYEGRIRRHMFFRSSHRQQTLYCPGPAQAGLSRWSRWWEAIWGMIHPFHNHLRKWKHPIKELHFAIVVGNFKFVVNDVFMHCISNVTNPKRTRRTQLLPIIPIREPDYEWPAQWPHFFFQIISDHPYFRVTNQIMAPWAVPLGPPLTGPAGFREKGLWRPRWLWSFGGVNSGLYKKGDRIGSKNGKFNKT